jgi:predicted dehydrogenase
MSLTRRAMFKQAAALGATVAIPSIFPRNVFGANDTIRIAVAGIHGRGNSHIDAFCKLPGCKVVCLVDPDSRLFDSKAKGVEKRSGTKPQCVQDIRRALEDKSIDVVSVATTNHWHSLITVWACQAGKDVYVEKPCSHNVFEGRQCVAAARKYKRIVQHGTQSRSEEKIARQIAAVHSGKYGKLLVSKCYCCKPRWSIGFAPITSPPAELDFDLWLGPAPKQPYHANLVHYNWHWFWDFGNGDSGNQGVHQVDIARWAIPGATLPTSVVTMGGRYVNEPDFKDQGQTPNMELSVFDYGGTLLVFETRGLVVRTKKGDGKTPAFPFKVANEFYLEAGAIIGGQFYPKGSDKAEPLVNVPSNIAPHGPFGNFIDCVRSRKQDQLNAEILEGHLSSALCHLGNISYRLGKEVGFNQKPSMGSDQRIVDSLQAIDDNLRGALNMDLAQAKYRMGPRLAFDPKAEKFIDNEAANRLLTRPYRAPYVVPKNV